MKKNELLKTLVIIVSTVVVTVGLAILLNLYTGPKIAANKAAAESGALTAVMPEGTAFEEITSTLTIDANSGVSAVYKETNGKGYVFMASAQGFSNPVNVTVGVDATGKIVGIDVVIGAGDYAVGNMPQTFIGQDATLSGVVMHAGATTSSKAVKAAVEAGFAVLDANGLIKAAEKTDAQILEELIPTVFTGFAPAPEAVEVSGKITAAFKHKTEAGMAYVMVDGEKTYLTITNAMGAAKVYELNEDRTALVEVTEGTEALVEEALTHTATALTNHYNTAVKRFEKLMETTTFEAINIDTFNIMASVVKMEIEGTVYYGFYSVIDNNFDTMKVYVVLDENGAIAKTYIGSYFLGTDHYDYSVPFPEGYYTQLEGKTNETYVEGSVIFSGATYSGQAFEKVLQESFDIYENYLKGGNE